MYVINVLSFLAFGIDSVFSSVSAILIGQSIQMVVCNMQTHSVAQLISRISGEFVPAGNSWFPAQKWKRALRDRF